MAPARIHRLTLLLLVLLSLLVVPLGSAQAEPDGDERTLSPYFFVEGGDDSVDRLPLESTHAEVTVNGTIAEVTVTQRYKNAGQRPINARYVFPAGVRAAVHGLTMKRGEVVTVAKIKEREAAKQQFERAKRQGKNASLLEQERPNVFTLSVSNIQPKDAIEVTLEYTELLVPTSGVYEFVFPTVVGPRYSKQSGEAKPRDGWIASPFVKAGAPAPAAFTVSGRISTPVAVADVNCPSHAIEVIRSGANLVRFGLQPGSQPAANRDFVLRFGLSGDRIQTGLSLFEKGGDKYFMVLLQPPKRVAAADVPAREYVFIVDVSGSMHGFPLDTTKRLLSDLARQLRPIDRFNVLLFSGDSELLSERSLPATPENIQRALAVIDQQQGGGGTELLAALQRALALPRAGDLSRSFVVVTDGYVATEREAMDLIRKNLNQANVFSFGIGTSVNRYLIDAVARAGYGEPFVVLKSEHAAEAARKFRTYIEHPVLTGASLRFEGFDAYDVEPKTVPDIFAERPVLVQGKWRGEPKGEIVLSGGAGTGPYTTRIAVERSALRPENKVLPLLWARTRIATLSDFAFGAPTPGEQREITQLGLKFNLLTQYTSFIAVSEIVRAPGALANDVQQPSALPAEVSEQALPSPTSAASEPELVILFTCFGFGVLLLWTARHLRARRTAS